MAVSRDDKKLDGGGLGDFWGIVKSMFTSSVFPVDQNHIAANGT